MLINILAGAGQAFRAISVRRPSVSARLGLATAAAALLACQAPAQMPAAAPAQPAKAHTFAYLNAADFAPDQLLPAPPAKGSPAEARELAAIHALLDASDAKRREQAAWDSDNENPAIFDQVLGRDLKKMPQTWALLTIVADEAATAASMSKAHFARVRPWGVDPSLPNCEAKEGGKPLNSYPSGHASLGYSVGFVLARLVPEKAPAILSRAADYAVSRQICGVHFPSDVEASHVLGTLVAEKLLADPRLAARIAAARAELAAR